MSKRQLEVINLIADGYSNQEIAQQLFLSVNTIKTHRKDLIEKYEARNSTHLVKLWLTNEQMDKN